MAYETIIRMIRKDVNELKLQMVALKAEFEGFKMSHQVAKPVTTNASTTKGGKR